jgi:hypothetical protein
MFNFKLGMSYVQSLLSCLSPSYPSIRFWPKLFLLFDQSVRLCGYCRGMMIGGLLAALAKASEWYGDSVLITLPMDMKNLVRCT